MSFRMGVNICEIVADREDIYGDGVNIACRLEALAPPGGICVSGLAREQTRGLGLWQYEDMGPRRLKNIDEPIRVYRLKFGHAAAVPVPPCRALLGHHLEDLAAGSDRRIPDGPARRVGGWNPLPVMDVAAGCTG